MAAGKNKEDKVNRQQQQHRNTKKTQHSHQQGEHCFSNQSRRAGEEEFPLLLRQLDLVDMKIRVICNNSGHKTRLSAADKMEKRATCSINSELAANTGYDTSLNSRHTLLLANTRTHTSTLSGTGKSLARHTR